MKHEKSGHETLCKMQARSGKSTIKAGRRTNHHTWREKCARSRSRDEKVDESLPQKTENWAVTSEVKEDERRCLEEFCERPRTVRERGSTGAENGDFLCEM